MIRKDREKDRDFALRVADTCLAGHMATVNPDGTPYCVAVNFVRKGDALYFHCAKKGQKTDNLAANPAVCIAFTGAHEPCTPRLTMLYDAAIVKGVAQKVEDEEEKVEALCLLCEKFFPEMKDIVEESKSGAPGTDVWKVQISEASGKSNRGE